MNKTVLILNEVQCRMIIKGLEYYSDMMYRVSYDLYLGESDDLKTILDQIPKEYFYNIISKKDNADENRN